MNGHGGRPGWIRWNDDGGPIPVRFEDDGAVTVDLAGLVEIIRQTASPDGLRQYLEDEAVVETLFGLAELPIRPDRRVDIVPIAGAISETDAAGAELEVYMDRAALVAAAAEGGTR